MLEAHDRRVLLTGDIARKRASGCPIDGLSVIETDMNSGVCNMLRERRAGAQRQTGNTNLANGVAKADDEEQGDVGLRLKRRCRYAKRTDRPSALSRERSCP